MPDAFKDRFVTKLQGKVADGSIPQLVPKSLEDISLVRVT